MAKRGVESGHVGIARPQLSEMEWRLSKAHEPEKCPCANGLHPDEQKIAVWQMEHAEEGKALAFYCLRCGHYRFVEGWEPAQR